MIKIFLNELLVAFRDPPADRSPRLYRGLTLLPAAGWYSLAGKLLATARQLHICESRLLISMLRCLQIIL